MWLAPTATPYGPSWPETMVVTPVPSGLASWIVPVLGKAPKLAQYRWAAALPVPVSGSVAVTVPLLLTAVSAAVSVPVLFGLNCTVTVQDLPGPKLIPVQLLAATANAAGPDNATVTARVGDPPVLASVNVCEAVCPIMTPPKLPGEGVKASTGPVLAAAGPAVATSAAAAPAATVTAATTVNRARCRLSRFDPMVVLLIFVIEVSRL